MAEVINVMTNKPEARRANGEPLQPPLLPTTDRIYSEPAKRIATSRPSLRQRTVITPEEARFFLTNNTRNRNLNKRVLERYENDMAEGRWVYNPIDSAIAFDKDMVLLNGQHRLTACARAGVPFEVDVIYNVDPELMRKTDIGVTRTCGNILQLEGVANANNLAAIAGWLLIYENYGITRGTGGNQRPSKAEVVDRVLADSKLPVCFAAVAALKHRAFVSNTLVGFCYYLFSAQDQVACDRFFEELRTGEMLSAENPARHLRERLMAERQAKAKLPNEHLIALCFRAWIYYRQNRPMAQLKTWRSDGVSPEPFPDINLKPKATREQRRISDR